MIASTPTFRCRSNIADIFFAFLAQVGANTKDRLHGPEILFVLRAAIFIHCVGFYQPWSIYSFLVEWAFHMTPNNQSQYKQINKIIHLSIKAAFSNAYEIVHYHDHYHRISFSLLLIQGTLTDMVQKFYLCLLICAAYTHIQCIIIHMFGDPIKPISELQSNNNTQLLVFKGGHDF